jgi:hypothetical protein
MGTIFEESHLPLHKWLQAIHLMVLVSKKGISAHQLHRVLECTYKTAWFLAHRIREAMRSGDFTPDGRRWQDGRSRRNLHRLALADAAARRRRYTRTLS